PASLSCWACSAARIASSSAARGMAPVVGSGGPGGPDGPVGTASAMEEVPRPGEVHGDPGLLRHGHHLFVSHGAAGLHHGALAGVDHDMHPIGEVEERIRGCHGAAGTFG